MFGFGPRRKNPYLIHYGPRRTSCIVDKAINHHGFNSIIQGGYFDGKVSNLRRFLRNAVRV